MNQRATPPAPASPPGQDAPASGGNPVMPEKTVDPTPHRESHTTPQLSEGRAPRLPHERDESSDSQQAPPQPIIEQAQRDVEAGRVDTDRGPVMDALYENSVKPPEEPRGRTGDDTGEDSSPSA